MLTFPNLKLAIKLLNYNVNLPFKAYTDLYAQFYSKNLLMYKIGVYYYSNRLIISLQRMEATRSQLAESSP